MSRFVKTLMYLLLPLSLLSCKKMVLYSPNEVRLGETEKNLNYKNIQKIQSLPSKYVSKFIVTGDSQRFYDELEDFVSSVNQRSDIDFVIINGDLSDFGQVKEFRWINDRLSKLNVPYINVIGNHDMLANGKLIFNQMFGPDNFSFSHNGSKFICLNSNSREQGFDGSLPNLPWLNNELLDLAEFDNAFVVSHVPPFSTDFDQALVAGYTSALTQTGKVRLSIHSHDPNYSLTKPYGSEVSYLVTGSMDKRSFEIVSVINETFSLERISF